MNELGESAGSTVAEADSAQTPVCCNKCGKPIPGAVDVINNLSRGIRSIVEYISKRVKCDNCLAKEQQARAQAAKKARLRQLQVVQADPAAILARCGVPATWRQASFASCPDLPGELIKDAQGWAEAPTGVIYLHGIPGSGKTWIAVSILRYVLVADRLQPGECRYVSERDYLDDLKLTYDSGQMERPARSLPSNHARRARLLVLDDLASTRLTDWGKGEIANLIEARHAEGLLTVITSNIDLDSLAAAVDRRISSRIAQYKTVLAFPDKDLRVVGSLSPFLGTG